MAAGALRALVRGSRIERDQLALLIPFARLGQTWAVAELERLLRRRVAAKAQTR